MGDRKMLTACVERLRRFVTGNGSALAAHHHSVKHYSVRRRAWLLTRFWDKKIEDRKMEIRQEPRIIFLSSIFLSLDPASFLGCRKMGKKKGGRQRAGLCPANAPACYPTVQTLISRKNPRDSLNTKGAFVSEDVPVSVFSLHFDQMRARR